MNQVFDSNHTVITTDGPTDFNLVQGEPYAIGLGGTFASSVVSFGFIDSSGNAIPVPNLATVDGTVNPLTLNAPGAFEVTALTNTLRVTASNPNPAAVAISAISASTAISAIASDAAKFTVTTAAAHGRTTGDTLVISGCTVAAYNGTWIVATAPDTTHLTVTSTLNPGNASDGVASGHHFTVTSAIHGLSVGDKALIAGANVAAYNGTWTVATVPDTTHFTVLLATNPGAANTGTVRKRLACGIGVTATRANVI